MIKTHCTKNQTSQCPMYGDYKWLIKINWENIIKLLHTKESEQIPLNYIATGFCNTKWTLNLKKVFRFRTLVNRVSKKISGPMIDEVTEGWWKPHNEGFQNLYSSLNISRMIKKRSVRWDDHVACTEAKRNVCKVLVENPGGKGTLRWMHQRNSNMELILNKFDCRTWPGFI
jgi:hypothetical protein